VNVIQEIERLKVAGEYYLAGKFAAANGQNDQYGCHFGMRSDYPYAIRQYKLGHEAARNEIEAGRIAAVNKAIVRSRPKIGKREAHAIHALLAPRSWEK
jgi:hypothetical protein